MWGRGGRGHGSAGCVVWRWERKVVAAVTTGSWAMTKGGLWALQPRSPLEQVMSREGLSAPVFRVFTPSACPVVTDRG